MRYGVRRLIVHAGALLALIGSAPAMAADRLILAFGDSLTAGYGLKPNEGFAPQLQAALRRDGFNVTVHNGGVSGDTTAQGRARLAWVMRGLKRKPDLVILALGANDMLRGLPPAQARANLDAMMTTLKAQKIPVVLAGMLASGNMGPAYRRAFDPIFPTLAAKHGAPLYPFFLRGVTGNRALTLPDGLHPNARGVAVMVRGVAPVVKGALKR